MIGTYGAGVLGLDYAGKFHPFEVASGHLEINPNAMLVTENHVLAGTLATDCMFTIARLVVGQ